jgi:ABC-2 type transport system permease protein
VVGALVFGVSWGSPLPATLLVVDFALVGCGAGLLVGALGRDEDRVSALTPIVGIVLGALGGCMVPLEVFPSSMRAIAHLTPHYWAIRSWQELVFDGAGVRAIAAALGVLAALAVLLTAASAILLHRDVAR